MLGFPMQSLMPHCLLQGTWFSNAPLWLQFPLPGCTWTCWLSAYSRGCTEQQPTPKLLLPDSLLYLNGGSETDSSRIPQATLSWDKMSLPNGHPPSAKPSGRLQKPRNVPFFETCSPWLSLLWHPALVLLYAVALFPQVAAKSLNTTLTFPSPYIC